MSRQQLMEVPAHHAKTLEPVHDVNAKALLRSANELSRVKRVNEMLKTELTKTRLKLQSVETELFKINGQGLWRAQTRRDMKKCASPHCTTQLVSALDRVASLEGQLAQAIAELDLERHAREDIVSDHTCFLCMDIVQREQRMVTKCCRRFDACASCFAEWVEAAPDHTCPFCRQRLSSDDSPGMQQ